MFYSGHTTAVIRLGADTAVAAGSSDARYRDNLTISRCGKPYFPLKKLLYPSFSICKFVEMLTRWKYCLFFVFSPFSFSIPLFIQPVAAFQVTGAAGFLSLSDLPELGDLLPT